MKDMLGVLVRKVVDLPIGMLGVICDLAEKLAGGDDQQWLAELKKFLRKENCWTDKILEFIGTVCVPARPSQFVARDNFIVNASGDVRVKISYLEEKFKKKFLDKIEKKGIKETDLRYQKLKKWSRNIPIINELGDEEAAETSLSEMFGLMEMQPNGEDGALLANGYANIFFIRDSESVLWAVHCRWGGDGWHVFADPVDDLREWYDGFRIFSRNSFVS